MLFVPLLLPLAMGIYMMHAGYEALLTEGSSYARLFYVTTLIIALPYAVFGVSAGLWCRHKTAAQIKKASWFLPWAFMPVCGLFAFVGFKLNLPQGDAGMAALVVMALSVPASFTYVAFAHIVTHIAKNAGLVKADHADA